MRMQRVASVPATVRRISCRMNFALVCSILIAALLGSCSSAKVVAAGVTGTSVTTPSSPVIRRGFLGAFFRPEGVPPFGVFSVHSKNEAPDPYPRPTTKLFGPTGYCDAVSADGLSISSGYVVDEAKVENIARLGVRWTRTTPSSFFDDRSHTTPATPYAFSDFDSAQCALVRHNITPLISLEAGPVQYDAIPGQFSPKSMPHYKTPADFGQWCGVVANHERQIFTAVHRYTLPGNEVDSNPELFPGGDSEIAAYSEACYKAVKAADPKAYVYGFELNMDRSAEPAAFVQRLYDLGCKANTCYDGISIHLSLRYPIPSSTTPCYPDAGGDYSLRCIDAVRSAAHAPVHILIGETVYVVPGSVPDEATKAKATVAELGAFAAIPYVDGVNYANVDECDMYSSGYFVGGCLIDSLGKKLPAYTALQALAQSAF
jgi:hypothetical protein